jgi:hypothetical protein
MDKEETIRCISEIEGITEASQLTFLAEALDKSTVPELAVPCLLKLLKHASALVREGAVYGLEGHLEFPGVREQLEAVANNDFSSGVRIAAREAVE